MDVLRLTLQSELTGDELERIAQKVSRLLVERGLLVSASSPSLLLTPRPSAGWNHLLCCLGASPFRHSQPTSASCLALGM